MNTEVVNKLHAELQSLDLQIEIINNEWQRLEEKWSNVLTDWEQKVIDIGQAIIELKAEHGKKWKSNYENLGFEFSYTVACRYAACAEQPDARGDATSVEKWAKAAAERKRATDETARAKEVRRKQRASTRQQSESQSSVSLAACEDQEPQTNGPTDGATTTPSTIDATDDNCTPGQMQQAFEQLNDAMLNDPSLVNLRPYWHQLLAGLEQGFLPHISAVSSYETDDTVEPGGSETIFDREAELLNA